MKATLCAILAAVLLSPRVAAAAAGRIEDNSFLIEEAYNQEPGVVHHISTFLRSSPSGQWLYTFTEEWPVGGQDHQVSATLPLARVGDGPTSATGIGDVQLHYRFAWYREESSPVTAVVRLTALLPTGDAAKGLGAGGAGMQVNLPLSVSLGERLVTHWNAGATWIPSARSAAGRGPLTSWGAGQSLVWLARPSFNPLLEIVWTETEASGGGGAAGTRSTTLTLNPGFRAAIDFASGLQVVWGAGVPIGVGPSRGEKGFLLYLSFEHPLGGSAEAAR